MSLGEILLSGAGVAAISGAVSYLVALTTRKTTIDMAKMQTAEKDREEGRKAFIASVRAWDMSTLEIADDQIRRARVTEARQHLLGVKTHLGKAVDSDEFDQLNDCLRQGDDAGLSMAVSLWPEVETTITDALARTDVQKPRRGFWGFWRRA